jgi:hypothetical protein
MPQTEYEKHQERRAKRQREVQARAPKPWYWFGQREPVARFTLYGGLFTLCLVLVGALQFLAIHGQQAVMQRQLDEMRDEQRAWVYTEVALSGLSFDDDGLHVTLSFTMHNTGRLPATSVIIDWRPRADIETASGYGAQREVCDQRRAATTGHSVGRSLFPGEMGAQESITTTIDMDELKRSSGYKFWLFGQASHPHLDLSPMIAPYVVGCIDYQTPGDKQHHQTGFSFMVMGAIDIGKTAYNGGIPLAKQVLPIDHFVMNRDLDARTFAAD